jgi:hypothetical protein
VINKLDNIRSILGQIKLDTGVIAKALSKPTSGQTAREGLKPRISKPRGGKKLSGLTSALSSAIKKSLGKVFDWAKWFGIIGLGLLFKDNILEFIKGAFEPLALMVSDWWTFDVLPALKKLDKAINPWSDKEGLFEGAIKVVNKWAKELADLFKKWGNKFEGWMNDLFDWSPKNMIFGSPVMEKFTNAEGVEEERPVKNKDGTVQRTGGLMGKGGSMESMGKYFSAVGEGFKQFGVDIGLITEEGSLTGGGIGVLAALTAALLIVPGPAFIFGALFSALAAITAGLATAGFLLVKSPFMLLGAAIGLLTTRLGLAGRGMPAGQSPIPRTGPGQPAPVAPGPGGPAAGAGTPGYTGPPPGTPGGPPLGRAPNGRVMSRAATERQLMRQDPGRYAGGGNQGGRGGNQSGRGGNQGGRRRPRLMGGIKGTIAAMGLMFGGQWLASAIAPKDEKGNEISTKKAAKAGDGEDTARAAASTITSAAVTGATIGLMIPVPGATAAGTVIGTAVGVAAAASAVMQGKEQAINEKEFEEASKKMDASDADKQVEGLRKMRTAIGNRYDKKAGRSGMVDLQPYAARLMGLAISITKLDLKAWRALPVKDFIQKSKQLSILLDAFSKTFIAVDSGLDPKAADKLYLKLLQANSFVQKIMNEDREITNKTGNWFGFGKDERKYKGAKFTTNRDTQNFGLGERGMSQIPSMARKSLSQAKPSTISGDKTTASLADLAQPKSTPPPPPAPKIEKLKPDVDPFGGVGLSKPTAVTPGAMPELNADAQKPGAAAVTPDSGADISKKEYWDGVRKKLDELKGDARRQFEISVLIMDYKAKRREAKDAGKSNSARKYGILIRELEREDAELIAKAKASIREKLKTANAPPLPPPAPDIGVGIANYQGSFGKALARNQEKGTFGKALEEQKEKPPPKAAPMAKPKDVAPASSSDDAEQARGAAILEANAPYKNTGIKSNLLGKTPEERDANWALIEKIQGRFGSYAWGGEDKSVTLADPKNFLPLLKRVTKYRGSTKLKKWLLNRLRVQKQDSIVDKPEAIKANVMVTGVGLTELTREQIESGMKITKGESGWIKRSLGKNALSKIKKVEDEKREAAMTDDERAKLTAAKKTARDAMPGSIAGRAAAQTATIDQNALKRETNILSSSPGTPPVVVAGGGGNGNSGSNIPSTPLVLQTPPEPDHRSSKDRN